VILTIEEEGGGPAVDVFVIGSIWLPAETTGVVVPRVKFKDEGLAIGEGRTWEWNNNVRSLATGTDDISTTDSLSEPESEDGTTTPGRRSS
jgi:hypothetical protein